jgi:polysaccharide biosynthesis/export protein
VRSLQASIDAKYNLSSTIINMNLIKTPYFSILAMSFLLISCAGSKKVAYMQSLPVSGDTMAIESRTLIPYEAHIKSQDILSITVVSSRPDASKIYNLLVPQLSETTNMITSTPTMQTYLVDMDGNIDFPILGKINVRGLTRKELEAQLQKRLEPEFSKERPVITIRITNYSVNVLGEVSRPGKYATTNDHLTIFESLALAGDMTIYGKRDNVKVLRERTDGTKSFIYVNLNNKNIIHSPAYYLEQNDVVYVEPNKAKSRSANIGSAETLGVSVTSILISLTSLLVTIFK